MRELHAAGVDLTNEFGQFILRCLKSRELPSDWAPRLGGAIQLARQIYHEFNKQFNAYFYEPCAHTGAGDGKTHGTPSRGEARLTVLLRKRFPSVAGNIHGAIEYVLHQIRNKRVHLLSRATTKYQGSLFGPRKFDPSQLDGYFKNVVRLESYHVPPEMFRCYPVAQIDFIAAPAAGGHRLDGRWISEGTAQYVAFYLRFPPSERLEALVSLGLGPYLREHHMAVAISKRKLRPVVRRASAFRNRMLPEVERALEQLGRQASRLTQKRLESSLAKFGSPGTPQQLQEVQERIERLEARLRRLDAHQTQLRRRLQPKPQEAARILNIPIGKFRTVRSERIDREVRLLKRRLEDSRKELEGFGARVPSEILGLLDDVNRHRRDRPPSPRKRGLSDEDRERRRRQDEQWRKRGRHLVIRASTTIDAVQRRDLPVHDILLRGAILDWLADVADCYECALLSRKGIAAVVGQRHGWRLDHLLR